MIQRLQTILLFIAAGFNFTLLFVPLWYSIYTDKDTGAKQEYVLYGQGLMDYSTPGMPGEGDGDFEAFTEQFTSDKAMEGEMMPFWKDIRMLALALLVIGTSLLLFFNIFLFKNRPLQHRLTYLAIILQMLQILMVVLLIGYMDDLVSPGEGANLGDTDNRPESWFKFGLLALVLSLLFAWWAARRIQKDEKKVQSMDRLR